MLGYRKFKETNTALTLTLTLIITDTGDLRTIEPSDYRTFGLSSSHPAYRVKRTRSSSSTVAEKMRDAQYHLNIFYMTVNYDSPGPDLGSPGGHGPGPPPAGAPTKQMLY